MVNVGFPDPRTYGFEMVDAQYVPRALAQAAINRKFTPNQMIRILSQFSAI
jgi:hypothetical protein